MNPRFLAVLGAFLVGGSPESPALNPDALEGPIDAFLGEERIERTRLFEGGRFPNVVVALDGTVVASWGDRSMRVRRSGDGGARWGPEIVVADPGFHGGGTLVDERNGTILVFVEDGHPPALLTVYRSTDHGQTWRAGETTIHPDADGNPPAMHMNESGITLRRGVHAGRLVRAARFYAEGNEREHWPNHYANAIYSDDGGRTWHTSGRFPEQGTGEAAIVELSDGRLYYNSRLHWERGEHNTRRRDALSNDGGLTWKQWRVVKSLPDGRQDNSYGCMAGLVRLPVAGRDILLFSNLDTAKPERERVTVWASFDGGRTWPVKRLVHAGPGAYSSLAAGRPGTPSEGWIYLFHEAGERQTYEGGRLARFNLSWVLAGEATGDGSLPGPPFLSAQSTAR